MELLLSLVSGGGGIFAVIAAIIAAIGAAYLKGKASGTSAERIKQSARDAEAMTEAQKIDEAVAGNAPIDNREALKRWGKKP